MKSRLLGLICGLLFGLGLAISQMMNPNKVLGFLDIAGNWDPSLALVMGGAEGVTLISFRWVLKLSKPLMATKFSIPTRTGLDRRLVFGAIVFGIGWGIGGYCPGPAIAALGTGVVEPWIFIVAFTIGNTISFGIDKLRSRNAPSMA